MNPLAKSTLFPLFVFLMVACSDPPGNKSSDNLTAQDETNMKEKKPAAQADEDHLYLEEVLGDEALAEVKSWNKRSLERLEADPRFKQMEAEALEILNSKDKIPYVAYRGSEVHNFWQDATHVRGIWRKSTLDSYLSESPVWETVLDYDQLAKAEDKNWVYKGNSHLAPDYELSMIRLSDGGKDAVVRREFNSKTKTFVADGFEVDESKGTTDWLDADHQVIAVDFGPDTMTDSGYPMIAKLWKRGTPLTDAIEIGRGEKTDVGYWPSVFELSDGRREIVTSRSVTFYESETFWFPRNEDGSVGEGIKFPIPRKADISGEFKGQILLSLNVDWRDYKRGDLVSFSIDDFMEDGEISTVTLIYAPDEKSSIGRMGITKSKVLLSTSTDVKGTAHTYDWDGKTWSSKTLDFPANGSVSIGSTNDKEDIAFISTESFLTPDTLWTFNTETMTRAKAKSLPNWFDAENMVSEQFFATSPDGTQVP